MKTCVKAELKVPSESILAWLHERFPELPADTQIQSIWANSYGKPAETVKIVIEHSHLDNAVVVVDDVVEEGAPEEHPTDGT